MSSSPPDVTDKFRIDTYVGNKMVGQKQVLASVVKEKQPADVSYCLCVCVCVCVCMGAYMHAYMHGCMHVCV